MRRYHPPSLLVLMAHPKYVQHHRTGKSMAKPRSIKPIVEPVGKSVLALLKCCHKWIPPTGTRKKAMHIHIDIEGVSPANRGRSRATNRCWRRATASHRPVLLRRKPDCHSRHNSADSNPKDEGAHCHSNRVA